jgi:hypothetical protein
MLTLNAIPCQRIALILPKIGQKAEKVNEVRMIPQKHKNGHPRYFVLTHTLGTPKSFWGVLKKGLKLIFFKNIFKMIFAK